ncbi:MAG: MFS transporter, partial [Candidatus Hydrogenedentes bacterium]|nr:MFS transporter [Candidatus Hydrogenedentota bacterium]
MSQDLTLDPPRRWYNGLTGYHYLVIAVASMGWMFDTMDQWLYVQVKTPAVADLLGVAQSDPLTQKWVGLAQTVFILGWATGGLFFGMVGDRLGRTKTMGVTILIYAGFTGLSGLAQTAEQFTILRFLTGLGIGGEFAAGAALVAESIPAHARATALGIVQAMSALGNVLAGVINFTIGANPELGWRWVFAVGVIPAFLLFIIFMFLREPQVWIDNRNRIRQGLEKRSQVPLLDLFSDRVLLRNTLVGAGLATVGVIGFWGISTWSSELMRNVVLNPTGDPALKQIAEKQMSFVIMAQNLGGFFGVLAFSWMAQRTGRRLSFTLSLLASAIVVPAAFMITNSFTMGLVMFALMGFVLLSMFGGYAIYFPELFPTRLRSTGTGFCYNVARFVAAAAPFIFGHLSGAVGIRYAALLVSSVFL